MDALTHVILLGKWSERQLKRMPVLIHSLIRRQIQIAPRDRDYLQWSIGRHSQHIHIDADEDDLNMRSDSMSAFPVS